MQFPVAADTIKDKQQWVEAMLRTQECLVPVSLSDQHCVFEVDPGQNRPVWTVTIPLATMRFQEQQALSLDSSPASPQVDSAVTDVQST